MKPKITTLTSLMTTLAIVIVLSSCKKEQVNHDKRNDFTVNQVLTDTLMVRSVVENINYLHQKAGFNIDSITNAIEQGEYLKRGQTIAIKYQMEQAYKTVQNLSNQRRRQNGIIQYADSQNKDEMLMQLKDFLNAMNMPTIPTAIWQNFIQGIFQKLALGGQTDKIVWEKQIETFKQEVNSNALLDNTDKTAMLASIGIVVPLLDMLLSHQQNPYSSKIVMWSWKKFFAVATIVVCTAVGVVGAAIIPGATVVGVVAGGALGYAGGVGLVRTWIDPNW